MSYETLTLGAAKRLPPRTRYGENASRAIGLPYPPRAFYWPRRNLPRHFDPMRSAELSFSDRPMLGAVPLAPDGRPMETYKAGGAGFAALANAFKRAQAAGMPQNVQAFAYNPPVPLALKIGAALAVGAATFGAGKLVAGALRGSGAKALPKLPSFKNLPAPKLPDYRPPDFGTSPAPGATAPAPSYGDGAPSASYGDTSGGGGGGGGGSIGPPAPQAVDDAGAAAPTAPGVNPLLIVGGLAAAGLLFMSIKKRRAA
jgi:hypothetical protein